MDFDFFVQIINIFLHLDKYLSDVIQNYGYLTYLMLFIIIFCETGLVILPFLPGDSLIFAAGAFAAKGDMETGILFAVLTLAAVLGDSVNYEIGKALGPKIISAEKESRFIKKSHIQRTHDFYEKYGAKTIIIARFVPIIRTLAPFLAGFGDMGYKKFIRYNVIGGVGWISICLFGGYTFGNMPVVKENFTLVILVIIFISILPALVEYFRHKYSLD
jgi:membrane-associated protein